MTDLTEHDLLLAPAHLPLQLRIISEVFLWHPHCSVLMAAHVIDWVP